MVGGSLLTLDGAAGQIIGGFVAGLASLYSLLIGGGFVIGFFVAVIGSLASILIGWNGRQWYGWTGIEPTAEEKVQLKRDLSSISQLRIPHSFHPM